MAKYLKLLENWGNTWDMRSNTAKCNIIRVSRTRKSKLFNYSLTGQVVGKVMDAKSLGVLSAPTWSGHNLSQP